MVTRKKLVVLSGAGMSQESGISTFRDSNGLWENHKIEDVASPSGWHNNKQLVLDFYNQRRKQMHLCQPNQGHLILAELEQNFDVSIITQNVDNLHERAGSTNVIHLHGELSKARSTFDQALVYEIEGWELNLGQKCEKGSQLRPHIVWFGEMVPLLSKAIEIAQTADIFLIIGTSLQVYPANQLYTYCNKNCDIYLIDPHAKSIDTVQSNNIKFLNLKATEGMEKFKELVTKNL